MRYKILKDGVEVNTIIADEDFVAGYCAANGYTYQEEHIPTTYTAPTTEDRVAALEAENAAIKEQLQQADDTAIELYEANMAQEEINEAQDDALIEIYELIGG